MGAGCHKCAGRQHVGQGKAAALTLALCQPQFLSAHLEGQPSHRILRLVACTCEDCC